MELAHVRLLCLMIFAEGQAMTMPLESFLARWKETNATFLGEPKLKDKANSSGTVARVPVYMMQLYQSLSKYPDLKLPGNRIRSFSNAGTLKSDSRAEYFFNILGANWYNENFVKAELRLFLMQQRHRKLEPVRLLRIDVVDNFTGMPVSSRMLSSRHDGWVIFPISNLVEGWLKAPRSNAGLRIAMRSFDSEQQRVFFVSSEEADKEPLLVVYSRDESNSGLSSLFKGKLNVTSKVEKPLRKRVRRRARKHRPCRVEPLTVPLSQIGWDKNFIAPKQFQINQCKGKCGHHSSKAYTGQTSHALLQALLAAVTNGQAANYPCCAPTKFESGTALVVEPENESKEVKIMQLERLTVTKCECL